ncbi:NAD(P)-dependent oxidoreductase [Dactylosporangium sp. McL0621]|uniref:NAD(P)-dependent oxidoreductase n=1 Tax=Dactylosporangium sp. McL0621 TaxID=3415678 RepID=UPI003CEF5E4E
MNVTVFGATGAIGSLTVAELLERGHEVTAYARNPQKIPAAWAGRVRVVIGEMSDTGAIDTAVAGADAVVSALGPSMDRKAVGLPLVAGTGHIIDAMQHHGVRRYIGHATPAVLDPHEKPTPVTRLIGFMPRTFMRRAYDEITGMTGLVTGSGLDWTGPSSGSSPRRTPRSSRTSAPGSSAPTTSASPSAAPTSPRSPPRRSTTPPTSAAPPPSATEPRPQPWRSAGRRRIPPRGRATGNVQLLNPPSAPVQECRLGRVDNASCSNGSRPRRGRWWRSCPTTPSPPAGRR